MSSYSSFSFSTDKLEQIQPGDDSSLQRGASNPEEAAPMNNDEMRIQFIALTEQMNRVAQKYDTICQQFVDLKSKYQESQDCLQKSESSNQRQMKENERVTKENSQLQQKCSESVQKLENLQNDFHRSVEIIGKSQKQIKRLNAVLKKKSHQIVELTDLVDDFKNLYKSNNNSFNNDYSADNKNRDYSYNNNTNNNNSGVNNNNSCVSNKDNNNNSADAQDDNSVSSNNYSEIASDDLSKIAFLSGINNGSLADMDLNASSNNSVSEETELSKLRKCLENEVAKNQKLTKELESAMKDVSNLKKLIENFDSSEEIINDTKSQLLSAEKEIMAKDAIIAEMKKQGSAESSPKGGGLRDRLNASKQFTNQLHDQRARDAENNSIKAEIEKLTKENEELKQQIKENNNNNKGNESTGNSSPTSPKGGSLRDRLNASKQLTNQIHDQRAKDAEILSLKTEIEKLTKENEELKQQIKENNNNKGNESTGNSSPTSPKGGSLRDRLNASKQLTNQIHDQRTKDIEINDLKVNVEKLTRENEELKEKTEGLLNDMKTKDVEIEELKEKNKKMENENEKTNETKNAEIEEQKLLATKLLDDQKAKENEIYQLKEKEEQAKKESAKRNEEIEDLKRQINEIQNDIQNRNSQISELNETIKHWENENKNENEKRNEEIVKSSNIISELNAQLDSLKETNSTLETEVEKKNKENEELSKKLQQISNNYELQISKLNEENHKLQIEITSQIDTLDSQKRTSGVQHENEVSILKVQYQKQIENNENKIKEKDIEISSLKEKVSNADRNYKTLEIQLQNYEQTKKNDFFDFYSHVKAAVADQITDFINSEVSKKTVNLRVEFFDSLQKLKEKSDKLEMFMNENERLKRENTNRTSQIVKSANNKSSEDLLKINKLETENLNLKRENEKLSKEVEDVKSQLRMHVNSAVDLQRNIESLRK